MPEPLPDDARYSLEQIKAAFWAMWLTYLISDAESQQYISGWWKDFTKYLSGAQVSNEPPKALPVEGVETQEDPEDA